MDCHLGIYIVNQQLLTTCEPLASVTRSLYVFQWFCVSYVICVNFQSTSVFASLKHSLGMGNSLWHGEALGKSLARGV